MVEKPHTIEPNPFTGGLGGVRLRVAMRVNARDWQRTLGPLIQGEVGAVLPRVPRPDATGANRSRPPPIEG